MAEQIKSLTSESLESAYRALTPSQQGFTEDLMASNVIIPVLDLTADAQGTSTPSFLQTAWDDTTIKAQADNNTVTLVNNTGFWKCLFHITNITTTQASGRVQINTGLTTVTLFGIATDGNDTLQYEAIVFLRAGRSIELVSNFNGMYVEGSCRQIADINGTLVNPAGFTPQ